MSERRDTRRVLPCMTCTRPIRMPLHFVLGPEVSCISCGGWDRALAFDRRDFYRSSHAIGDRINPYVIDGAAS